MRRCVDVGSVIFVKPNQSDHRQYGVEATDRDNQSRPLPQGKRHQNNAQKEWGTDGAHVERIDDVNRYQPQNEGQNERCDGG